MSSNSTIHCNSSSSHLLQTYDVFVSFRGEDTRNNFTGFLFEALRKKGIRAFRDNTDLKKGESIAPELLHAIEGSRIFVVVFSKNYASSTWCLRELAHICNCTETPGRHVLPIFYDVDPSDVRKQREYYQKAFSEHEERFREDNEMMKEIQKWREALTRVANHSGWDIRNKSQYSEIEVIVKDIINILGKKFSYLPHDNLVGIESRVDKLSNLLTLESDSDVRVVGVWGMGGIGKTTLVRALYERISDEFDHYCFIDDVSKLYRDSNKLGVQKQLLSQCLNEQNLEIDNVSKGTYLVLTRLRNGKTLIILDNVDQIEQLKIFSGNRENLFRECLGKGSRIIIISRDERILKIHGADHVYLVEPLNGIDAVRLLYQNAFKSNYVMSGYKEYINIILSYVEGHPLAIEVLGSSLFGRSVSEWRSVLTRLRKNKSKDIMHVLRISFDQLDDSEKEIFLDIACFLKNEEVEYVKEILEFRGFEPEYGLQVLNEKSLIKYNHHRIYMHDLLVDMGRCIVREKSPKEPREWSRLWDYEDFLKVMSDDMSAENLEVIDVSEEAWDFDETTIRADALSKMTNLQLLKLRLMEFCGNLNHLSNNLRYLKWDDYPFYSLPPSFQADKLVELSLICSNIKQLWKDTKPLHNLRRLNLSCSKNLLEMPNLCKAVNLEYVDLQGCTKLRQIDPFIGFLTKLTDLNLQNCASLTMLPRFGEAINLEKLNLEGCSKLRQIDPSIGLLKRLTFLNLKDCRNLVSLPDGILGLKNLEYLSISGCSKLYKIKLLVEPRDNLLKNICEGEAPANSQSAFSFVKKWPSNLLHSRARKDKSTVLLLSSLFGFSCLRQLDLSFCNLLRIPDAIGNLHSLEKLNVSGNNFAILPSLKELSRLYYLNIQHCKQLKYLSELPSRTEFPSPPSGRRTFVVEPGIHIFNCPELVESKLCTSMGLSWMIQIIQACYQYNYFFRGYLIWFPCMSSIIPGSEIPKWFQNQHEGMGSSITIDECPLGDGGGYVACCVVCSVCSERKRYSWMRVVGDRYVYGLEIPVDLNEDLVTDKSDHMWLFYLDGIRSGRWIFEIYDKERRLVQVKRYGYRWDTYLTKQ